MAPAATTSRKPSCRHCGAPLLDSKAVDSGFCCSGCAYVHRLVSEEGLDSFYKLKDEHTAPADPSVFQPRDYAWLDQALQEAETGASVSKHRIPSLTLSLQGISCAGCVWLIERLFAREPGSRDIVVNAQLGELSITWNPGEFSASDFARKIQSFGYLAGPRGEAGDTGEASGLVRRMGLCAAFAMNVMLFTLPVYFGMEPGFEYARLFGTISFAFGTLSLLVGGSFFLSRAARMLREGELHIDLPIAIGILGAYLGSLYGWIAHDERFVYWDFVTAFILLMLTGRWAQVVAVERNRRQLLRQQIKPPKVRLISDLSRPTPPSAISPEELSPGMVFEVDPGQGIPVDARLLSTGAMLSLASINGESEPRTYKAGETVPSGSINIGLGSLQLEALQPWSLSLLAQLLTQGQREGWRHRLLDQVIRGYLIGIFIAALLGGLGWWFSSHDPQKTWSVVIAVLVVSCPCAIGLSFPLAEEMATTALRRAGVYVRENDLWARLSRIRRIVFDKTGTLTLETPELSNPGELARLSPQERNVLFSMVRTSAHPFSQSLHGELLASGELIRLEDPVTESIGHGLIIRTGDIEYRLGKPDWALRTDAALAPGQLASSKTEATVIFSCQGAPLASFHFADHARADAAEEIHRLQDLGYSISILSGDRPDKVARLATQLGLPPENAQGSMSPSEKASWITAHDDSDTLMLGDGANDSLAFETALCRGTPVIHRGLLEQHADFFYLGRGIGGVRALIEVDRIRRRTQTLIIAFSIAYNVLTVGLALAGMMNPLVAAILMPLNSLLGLLLVSAGMRKAFTRS